MSDNATAATRKVIARIPQAKSDYRADPKARNAREIAWLIVQEEISLGLTPPPPDLAARS